MYVYIRSESSLYTVGFYNPKGEWVTESDHESAVAAAKRVAFLNGKACINGDRSTELISKAHYLIAETYGPEDAHDFMMLF